AIAGTTGDPAQAAARQALSLIHRGASNKALMDLLPDSKPETQIEIIRALSNRREVEAVPKLFQLARQTDDPVRDATFQALARLVNQPQLDELAKIIPQMTTDASRASAAGALVAACRRIQRQYGSVDMTPVWEALRNGSPKTRIALLPVCSSLAGPETREILRTALADHDPEIHAAAVRALCDTTDAALVPDVTKLACDPADKDFHTLAIESCVRLTTQEDSINIPDSERIKLFQALVSVTTNPAEKRVVLAGLATIPDASALQLAQPFLSDVTVSNEAARTVIGICRKLPDVEAAKTALEQLNSPTTSEQIRQGAGAALKMVMARADYITTWQFAGPYSQAGQTYTHLFDIVFPPETSGATNINWRDLPSSDDPDHPWVMDLLKAIGGEQEVAYARTSIHSDNEQEALLTLNSDDGAKVWLNGNVIVARNIARALNGPADKVKITLKPGWNNLLFKVTQNNAGWGFWAKLTDSNGAKLKGVQYEASPDHSSM
ncbi:MAG TPA: HEAT repeat domain-containing protein, partial [Verrucomicrobiae bacterium]|nr:HEAT repeat domain-containing protein [Verrucomicrobiae bacterium]